MTALLREEPSLWPLEVILTLCLSSTMPSRNADFLSSFHSKMCALMSRFWTPLKIWQHQDRSSLGDWSSTTPLVFAFLVRLPSSWVHLAQVRPVCWTFWLTECLFQKMALSQETSSSMTRSQSIDIPLPDTRHMYSKKIFYLRALRSARRCSLLPD